MFRWFRPKWHHVRWSCGDRHVGLSLRFDTSAGDAGASGGGSTGSTRPSIQRIQAKGAEAGPGSPAAPDQPDEERIIADVLSAVEEFNQRNRTAVRVAAIRYRADDTYGHLEAARKLLNRM